MTDLWVTPDDPVTDDYVETEWGVVVATDLRVLFNGVAEWLASPSQDVATNFAPTANKAYGFPFTQRDAATIAYLAYLSDTTAGNIDVGIYEDDGNGTTCSKLKTNGGQAMAAGATVKKVNLSASQALSPFQKYWAWIAFSSASARVKGTGGPSTLVWRTMATAYPLPTVITFAAAPSIAPALFAELT